MSSRSATMYGAGLAAAAAVLFSATAAATAQKHHRRHHVVIRSHLIHHAKGHIATCPPGVADPRYCVPPTVDNLYEAFSISTTASARVSTSVTNELLVAFVQSNGPRRGGQSSTVSGGGVTWRKAAAENRALGDSEVWYAVAPSKIANQKVTATATLPGFDENLTIVTFKNARGIASARTFYSLKGAPSGTITTTQPQSWVWASGNDPRAAFFRFPGFAQNTWVQVLDFTARSTFWTQSTVNPTSKAGTSVTINDVLPVGEPYNLALVEIR